MTDLTSLASLKAWLNITTTTDDVLLSRLISQVSGLILNELQRPSLARTTYTELRDGVGNQRMTLRNWPVISITSLDIDDTIIPVATDPPSESDGYTLQTWDGTGAGIPQELLLRGYTYCRGKNNIKIVYDAGYAVSGAAYTIPSGAPYIISFTPANGAWVQDDGVTNSAGTAFTSVAANVTPTTGQYNVVAQAYGAVTYTFAAADAGTAMLLSYSYSPLSLEQACIEWVGERYRYRSRIGLKSLSVGGNVTESYDTSAIPPYVDRVLRAYRKFLPL